MHPFKSNLFDLLGVNLGKVLPFQTAYAVLAAFHIAKENWNAEYTRRYGTKTRDFIFSLFEE